ncbi:MAG: hypothetical protein KFF50_00555 [Desulfatitalea sp.]|nr:hypothetical protein [Desulfatitalea sp.]
MITIGLYTAIKVVASILVVLLLSLIAERIGPRFAGVVSGYPLGAAISLFFIGLEQGAGFAAHSAIFAAGGLAATVAFVAGYLLGLRGAEGRRRFSALAMAVLSAFCAYGLAAWGLSVLALNWLGAPAIALLAIILGNRLFRAVPEVAIQQKMRLGIAITLLRALFAAVVILAITTAAHAVGPRWAGLFSAFPITMLPLLVIIQATYQPAHVRTIIRNIPRGLISLLVYTLTVAATYPKLGIAAGTLVGYLGATVYLVAMEMHRQRRLHPHTI